MEATLNEIRSDADTLALVTGAVSRRAFRFRLYRSAIKAVHASARAFNRTWFLPEDVIAKLSPEAQSDLALVRDQLRAIILKQGSLRDDIADLLQWKHVLSFLLKPVPVSLMALLMYHIDRHLSVAITTVRDEDKREREAWNRTVSRHPSLAEAAKIGPHNYDRHKSVRVDWETFQPLGD